MSKKKRQEKKRQSRKIHVKEKLAARRKQKDVDLKVAKMLAEIRSNEQ